MAIPRKVGLPVTPPPNRGDGNTSKQGVNAPVRPQNQEDERQSTPHSKKPQNREKRTAQNPDLEPKKRRKTSNNSSTTEQDKQKPRERRKDQSASRKPTVQKPEAPAVEDGYAIDPKTGIKHRVLPGANPDAVKSFNSLKKSDLENLTFTSMKYYFTEAEDFDVEDLDNTAQDFLGHLRIAPDKDEQKRLREERAARKRDQNEQFTKEQERLNNKYGEFVDPGDIDE